MGKTLWVGDLVCDGRFRIDEVICRGRTFDIYLGADLHLDAKRVVVKVARANGDADSWRARFDNEARFLTVQSALIPEPLDIVANPPALVIERLSGETLATALERSPGEIGAARAIAIVRELSLFASEIHAAGWVFRDFAPDHVVVGFDDVISVVGTANAGRLGDAAPATKACATAGFAAPEVEAGEPCDERTDVYSLGALLAALTRDANVRAVASRAMGQGADGRRGRIPNAAELAREIARVKPVAEVVVGSSPGLGQARGPSRGMAPEPGPSPRPGPGAGPRPLPGRESKPPQPAERSSRWLWIVIPAIGVAVAAGLIYLLVTGH